MSRVLALAVAITPLCFSAAVSSEGTARAAECTRDKDCPGDQVCRDGQCANESGANESADAPGRVCEIASDCPPEQTCQEGRCALPSPQPPPPAAQPATEPQGPAPTLLTAGIVSLGVGYGMALIGGGITTGLAVSQTSKYKASCVANGPLNFIPLVGPWLYAATYPDHDVVGYGSGSAEVLDCNSARGVQIGIVAAGEVLELGGAALIATSFIVKAMTKVPLGQGAWLHLSPGAIGAPVGLTLELDAVGIP